MIDNLNLEINRQTDKLTIYTTKNKDISSSQIKPFKELSNFLSILININCNWHNNCI